VLLLCLLGDTVGAQTGHTVGTETGDTIGAQTGDTVGTETGDTVGAQTEGDTVGTETGDTVGAQTEGDTVGVEAEKETVGAEKKEREIFTSGRPGHSATSGTVIDSSGGVGEVSRAVRYYLLAFLWPLYSLSLNLMLQITSFVSSNISFGHCILCPSI
jgi:hypothetical protein